MAHVCIGQMNSFKCSPVPHNTRNMKKKKVRKIWSNWKWEYICLYIVREKEIERERYPNIVIN